jgi:predicted ATPase
LAESRVTQFFKEFKGGVSANQILSEDQCAELLSALAEQTPTTEELAAYRAVAGEVAKLLPRAVFEAFKHAFHDNDPAYAAMHFMLLGEIAQTVEEVQRSVRSTELRTSHLSDSASSTLGKCLEMEMALRELIHQACQSHALLIEQNEHVKHYQLSTVSSMRSLERTIEAILPVIAEALPRVRAMDEGVALLTLQTPKTLELVTQVKGEVSHLAHLVQLLLERRSQAIHADGDGEEGRKLLGVRTIQLDPEPLEATVGRERDAAQIVDRFISRGVRMLVLSGPPCVGKSTLALHAAHRVVRQSGWLGVRVDLANARTADDIATLICETVGGRIAGDRSKGAQENMQQNVVSLLQGKGPMLLLLDHYEHLHAYTRHTLVQWLRSVPELRIMVASRSEIRCESLDDAKLVRAEVFDVAPLPIPSVEECAHSDVAALMSMDAVRLFVDRACKRAPEFTPDRAEAEEIARICRVLGGFPACIELAAACIESATLSEILASVSDVAMQPFGDDDSEMVSRKYLYPALDLALSQLTQEERQSLFEIASYPAGLVVTDAATALALGSPSRAIRVLTKLRMSNLIEIRYEALFKALHAERRVYLYEPIRQYALQMLASVECSSEREVFRRRMREQVLSLADRCNKAMRGSDEVAARSLLLTERANLESILDGDLASGDAPAAFEVLSRLEQSYAKCGPASRMCDYAARVLSLGVGLSAHERARLKRRQSESLWTIGDYDGADRLSKASLRALESDPTSSERSVAIAWQAKLLSHAGSHQEAFDLLAKHKQVLDAEQDRDSVWLYCDVLANCYDWSGRPREALPVLHEVEKVAVASEDRFLTARIINRRGIILWHDGHPSEAYECFGRACELNRALKDPVWVAGALTNGGLALTDSERFGEAAKHFDEAEAIHKQLGSSGWRAVNLVGRARMYLYQHRYRDAIDEVQRIEADVARVTYSENLALMNAVRAIARYRAGEVDRARHELGSAVDALLKGSQHMLRTYAALVTYAECLLELGESAASASALQKALGVAQTREITRDYRVAFIRDVAARGLATAEALHIAPPVVGE